MKTKKSKLQYFKAGTLISLVVIGLLFSACEKLPEGRDYYPDERPEAETYMVSPDGTTIIAQKGEVYIEIPKGAVLVPTELKINYKKDVQYDSYILMDKVYSIKLVDQQLLKPVTIKLKYCPEKLGCTNEELIYHNKQIHRLNIFAYGNDYSMQTIYSHCFSPVGDCCVDTDKKTIQACFSEFGNFVVGVKQ
jgi:hypothetical protein